MKQSLPSSSSLRSVPAGLTWTSLLSVAGSLAAQTPTPAPQPKPAGEVTDLPEVVVSAETDKVYKPERLQTQKYTVPLRDVPQTITVVPKSVIQERGATSLRDVLRNVPGISIQAGEGGVPAGDNMSIRGFSARTDMFVDGIRDFGGYTRDPFNMEQVEVAKGPSSANAGRGSTGGSVNMVSKSPKLQPGYQIEAGAGTDSYFRNTLDLNQPLGEHTALRLNTLYHNADTPGRGEATEERFGLAASLAFGLETDTRFTLSYFHMEQEAMPDYGIPWVPGRSTTAGVTTTYLNGLGSYINQAPPVSYENYYGLLARDYERTRTDIVTAQFEHDFSDKVKITNTFRVGRTVRDSVITAPRFLDVQAGANITYDGTITRQLQSRDQTDSIIADQINLTAKFETGFLKHDLVAGGEFVYETSKNYGRAGTAAPTTNIYNPNPNQPYLGRIGRTGAYTDAESLSLSAYAFDTIHIGDQWEVSGGLRYDRFTTKYKSVTAAGVATNLGRTDEMLSWRAGVVYKPRENGSIYAAYGTSFNPSAEGLTLSTTANAANNISIDPEQSNTIEFGTKWDLLDERLQLTAALFRTTKTNARTEDVLVNDIIVLDGEQRVQGIEFGFAGNITDKWRVFGGYAYLQSEILYSKTAAEINRPVNNTPEHTGNLWTVYDLPHGFQIGFGMQYIGTRFNGNSISSREAPAYVLFDALLGYEVNKNFSLRLNVNNLTDEEYIDRLGGGHFVPGNGRLVMLTATYKF